MARDVHGVHTRMKAAVNATDGVELVCDSDLCIVPITSASLEVKAIAGAMGKRGWSLFASADPAPRGSIEVCVGAQHAGLVDEWCADLADSVAEVRAAPAGKRATQSSGGTAYTAVVDDGGLKDKLRDRLKNYVERSLEVPKNAKM
jgi:hypothetical protein